MSITTKNFKTKLSGFIRSAKTQRETLQGLLVFGMEQAKDHGNLDFLSQTLNSCIGVKSLPTVTLKDYIKEHVQGIAWKKGKDGSMAFSKAAKDVKIEVAMPESPWWEFGHHNAVQADMDIDARVKSLLTNLRKAMKEGRIKEGQQEKAGKAEQALQALLA